MSDYLMTPIADATAWTAAEMRTSEAWRTTLTAAHVDEVEQALARVIADGTPLERIDRSSFPLPTLGDELARLNDVLEGGRGFHLLRGVPVAGRPLEEVEIIFWGLCQHIGTPEPQDVEGKVLHHVRALKSPADFATSNTTRGFETNIELGFHGDGSDALAFLCWRGAKAGGLSRLVSATTIFNEVLRRRPDLARVLQEPFYFDARGQRADGKRYQRLPIYTFEHGLLNILYKRGYIELAQRFEEVPRLSQDQIDAMDLIDAVSADPHFALSFMMEPGDIQFANNFSMLHSRTQFEDHDEPERRRHMLRIWMTLHRGRALPTAFRDTREFGACWARRQARGDAQLEGAVA